MNSNELIKKVKVPFGFQTAKERLDNLVKQFKGWSFPIEAWDFNKAIVSSGFNLKNIKNMVIYFLCNASYASQMINAQAEISVFLPCTYVVFETEEHETYLLTVSMNSLGEFFSEPLKKIMQEVDAIEKGMIKKLVCME
jgi:hypothetical protein